MRKKVIIIIAGLVLFNSCGSNDKHEQDLTYIVTIGKCMNRASDKTNGLIHELYSEALLSSKDLGRKLPDSSYNGYIKASKESIVVIDSAAKAVSLLEERDADIKLKQSILTYLEGASKYFREAFPMVIDVIRNGIGNIKPEQIEDFKKYMQQGKAFLDETDVMENKFDAFLKQHNISMDDLKKQGVRDPSDTTKT